MPLDIPARKPLTIAELDAIRQRDLEEGVVCSAARDRRVLLLEVERLQGLLVAGRDRHRGELEEIAGILA
jgi:hypothetical protein